MIYSDDFESLEWPTMIPLDDDMEVDCVECQEHLTEEACILDDEYMCEDCGMAYLEEVKGEAIAFAVANCKITGPVELYDPTMRFAPSQDEYHSGNREAYTENSVEAHNRHNRTNYEDLIKDLDRRDPVDDVRYWAIRARIRELLEDAVDEAECEQDERDALDEPDELP
jgi:hypothetical protein